MNSTTIIAIACITILELWAIYNHMDGTILAGALSILGGLGGYTIAKSKKR